MSARTWQPLTRPNARRCATALDALTTDTTPESAVDPKDKREVVDRYRRASELAEGKNWAQAIVLLEGIVRNEPELIEVWNTLARVAARVDRFATAVDAYQHVAELAPADPSPLLGAAEALLRSNKLDEARLRAQAALDYAADDTTKAIAHQLLTRIALARRDPDEARTEAELAVEADPSLPMAAYVEGRLLYDHGKFAEALPPFEEAIAAAAKKPGPGIDELHFYVGDTFSRLERLSEAEFEFEEQLRVVPQHARARAGLAMVYLKTGRTDEAEQAAIDLIQLSPTPDGYALAIRIWRALGKPRQAEALREEARKAFAGQKRSFEPPPATVK